MQQIDLVSAEFKRNPFPTFAKMRGMGPLIKTKIPMLGEAWITSTYEASVKILRDKESFVSEPKNAGRKTYAGLWWMPPTLKRLTKNMLTKDEPDHRRLRELVESAFMKQSIDDMRPRLAMLADEHLDHLEWAADQSEGTVDLVEHFARPFPLAVISELMGFPEQDRPKFLKWGTAMGKVGSSAWGC